MKKNELIRKQWLSIKEAANRLSSETGQNIESADVIQLCLDGVLNFYCHMRQAPALEAYPYSKCAYVPHSGIMPPNLKNRVYINRFLEMPVYEEIGITKPNTISPGFLDSPAEARMSFTTSNELIQLSGLFKLEIINSKIKDWLFSTATDTPVRLTSADGWYVSNSDGDFFQVQEFLTMPDDEQPGFNDTYLSSSASQTQRHFNMPSINTPDFNELAILSIDIDELLTLNPISSKKTGRTEQNLYRTIGLLSVALAQQTDLFHKRSGDVNIKKLVEQLETFMPDNEHSLSKSSLHSRISKGLQLLEDN